MANDQLASTHASSREPTEAGHSVESIRVMLAEDDDSDAELITRMLQRSESIDRFTCHREVDARRTLEHLGTHQPDVLLLDLGLPDASGLSALELVRAANPLVPVVVITGSHERSAGIAAVRDGAQDYLIKDELHPALLAKSIRYAIERARAVDVERQLLEETLHGTINALTTVLAMVDPIAFGRAARLKDYVAMAAARMALRQQWCVEIAAMVSQIGAVQQAMGQADAASGSAGDSLERRGRTRELPAIAAELLQGIPRLDAVRAILRLQVERANGDAPRSRRYSGEIQLGAELLDLAVQFDALETKRGSKLAALDELDDLRSRFNRAVFDAFVAAQTEALDAFTETACSVAELIPGVVLASDVLTLDGRLVIARGSPVTSSMLARLMYFSQRARIAEPLHVLRRKPASEARIAG